MPINLKELVVILFVAALVFGLGKRLALNFTTATDFEQRRNAWLILTVTAFLSPSYVIFILVAIPTLLFYGRRDKNPAALYLLLLHVIPSISFTVPMIGISYLFYLDNYLLLSCCILVPAALRLRRADNKDSIQGLEMMDFCLIGYGLLQSLLYIHGEIGVGVISPFTLTNALRRAAVFFLAAYIPFFVVSRGSVSRKLLAETMAFACLGCALMAAIAVVESLMHWLLYPEIAVRWGYPLPFGVYLMRAENIRATASAGHSLALGYMLAIGFGLWLYLKSRVEGIRSRFIVSMLFWGGLLAAYSRGPWLGAAAIYFCFVALGRHAIPKLAKAACVVAILATVVFVSPIGDRVIKVLPILGGSVDSFNVEYRSQLFHRAWQLIKESPMLGDQSALLKLQSLRQGQGIIDVVNTYVQVLLDNGFVGLTLFLGFMLIGLSRALGVSKRMATTDADLSTMGLALVACILGTFLMIENSSFILGYEIMYYVLAALAAGYVQIGHRQGNDNAAKFRQTANAKIEPPYGI